MTVPDRHDRQGSAGMMNLDGEVHMLTSTQKQLLDILAGQLFGKPLPEYTDTDWPALMKEAKQQAVYPIVFQAVEERLAEELPEEQFQQYQDIYMRYLAANFRVSALHASVHKLMTENKIPYVILKGLSSSDYYPEPLLRPMGDVDFLVSRENLQQADQLLRQEGFERDPETVDHPFHWEYNRGKDSVELHWNVPGVPLTNRERYMEALEGIVPQGTVRVVSDTEFVAPTEYHHGLVLLLHTAGHLTAKGIGIRHLCDWLVFENGIPEERFVLLFRDTLQKIGLWTFACAMTDLGVRYFGCGPRAFCSRINTAMTDRLLEDFFDGGNFGEKNSLRQGQMTMFRSYRSRRISGSSFLRVALDNMDYKTKQRFPICVRHPALYPACWIAMGALAFYHRVSGEGTPVLRKGILLAARDRQKLYNELKLFTQD